MNTRETLILKTLQLKQFQQHGHSIEAGELVDRLLAADPQKADELTKNVCARIPVHLSQELESICGLLDLNKREVITMALEDFLEKAAATLDEFNAFPEGGI